jgi:hypothetical protein
MRGRIGTLRGSAAGTGRPVFRPVPCRRLSKGATMPRRQGTRARKRRERRYRRLHPRGIIVPNEDLRRNGQAAPR